MILRVIERYPNDAHGVGIARHLRKLLAVESPEDSQIYGALGRLEARRLIELSNDQASQDMPSSERPRKVGRPRKLYSLTVSGKRALSAGAEQNDPRRDHSSILPGETYGYQKDPAGSAG